MFQTDSQTKKNKKKQGPLDPKSQTPTTPPYTKTAISTLLSLLNDSTHAIPYSIAQARGRLAITPSLRLPLLSISTHLTSVTEALVTEDKKMSFIPSHDEDKKEEDDGSLQLLPLHDPVGFPKRLHDHVKSLVEDYKVRTVLVGGEYVPLGLYESWKERFGELGKAVEVVISDAEDVEKGVVDVVLSGGWVGIAGV